MELESAMAITKGEWNRIKDLVTAAITKKSIASAPTIVAPQGLRKLGSILKEWGVTAAAVGALLTLLAISITLLLAVLHRWDADARFQQGTEDRLKTIEANVSTLQSQLGLRIPTSLKQLIQPLIRKPEPSVALNNLKSASSLIDAAFRVQLPSSPELLQPIRQNVQTLRSDYKQNSEVSTEVVSVLIRLDCYIDFSRGLQEDKYPATHNVETPVQSNRYGGIFNLSVNCLNPAATLVEANPQAAENFYLVDVADVGCQQSLDYFPIIRTHFKNTTIHYNGGLLRLAEVTFENCSFEFGNCPECIEALKVIRRAGANPVTLLIEPASK